jgi:hypothetical protein
LCFGLYFGEVGVTALTAKFICMDIAVLPEATPYHFGQEQQQPTYGADRPQKYIMHAEEIRKWLCGWKI